MNTYDVGDLVQVDCAVVNSDGIAVDPTTLTLTVKPAAGTATVYTYGTGTVIVRDSLGNYHANIPVTSWSGGTWRYKWTATGAAQGMEPGEFSVRSDSLA